MLWMARNPLPSLPAGPESGRWPISTIGQYAVVGLYGLECSDEEVFRWTHPIFLLRFKWTAKAALTLETRNLRRHIGLSDIVVVVAGRALSSRHIALDDTGNITLSIEAAAPGETDVVVILPELREPAASGGHGRRLGLPLFSVGFAPD
jgi:hypothetical protein